MKTNKKGRCVECERIPRPDIARALGEDPCRCDETFNVIQDRMDLFFENNERIIDKLAENFKQEDDN